MSVATPTAAVLAMEDERKLPRALMGGTKAMRAAGTLYLPREPAESEAAHKVRLARSFLFNGYGKTVRDMTGKVFAKPIALGEDVPEPMVEMAENVDLAGRNLDVFAWGCFKDALAEGISYILVEMDPAPRDEAGNVRRITRADERAMNRRPWMVHIKARQMLGWRSATVNGVDVLTQVRFMETVTEDDGAFGEKMVDQVRVFFKDGGPVRWQTWRRREQATAGVLDEWVPHEEGSTSLSEIAICPIYVARTGLMSASPPLADLAEVNLSHWQSQSDQRNILHVARVPILFGSGFSESGKPIEIGAGRMITVSDAQAKLAYVEHSGAAIESGRTDLKDLEFQMQTLGLELLVPKPGGQSATGAAIDQAKMHAPLAMMAGALQDAIEQAFGFMAQYAGLPEGGSVTVNRDFGVSMRDAQDLTTLLGAVNAGVISRETFIREMVRRGVVAEDVDPEEELQRVLDEGHEPDDESDATAALINGLTTDVAGRNGADAS